MPPKKKRKKKYTRGYTQLQRNKKKKENNLWDSLVSNLLNLKRSALATQGESFTGIWGLFKKLKKRLTLGKSFRLVKQSFDYLWRFNWNISDEEIDEQLGGDLLSLSSILGGAVGATVGWTVCGAAGSAILLKIDPAMAVAVGKELGEEAKDEIVQAWTQVAYNIWEVISQNAFKQVFKFARRLIKSRKWGTRIFGERYAEILESWGKPGGEVISLSKWKNDRIEEIPNEYLKNFAEEFFEEFGDSCNEAIMVIAGGIDSYQALQSTTIQDQVLGADQIVKIVPNKEEQQEFVFYGKENLVRQEATSFLAHYQMMYGKDIGQYVGEPAPQYQMKKVHTVSAVIRWQSKVTPPYREKGEKFKAATLTIPDLKTSGITWRGLQKAAGGVRGFMSGPSKYWCKLSCGAQTMLWADNEELAEEIVQGLMEFSASEITAHSNGTQKKTKRQNNVNRNFKERIMIYPFSVTFFRTGTDKRGRVRLYDEREEPVNRRSLQLPLWQQLENPQYDETIKEFLQKAFADIPREI